MNFSQVLARARWIIVGLLVVGFLVIVSTSRLITEWLWFQTLGYEVLFVLPFLWRLGVGAAVGIVSALFIWINVRVSRESIAQALFRHQERIPQGLTWKWAARVLLLGSAVLGFLYGASASEHWETIARGLHGQSFGTVDPLFSRDIGFYVFDLPVLDLIQSFVMGLFVLTALLVGAIYFASGSFRFEGWRLRLSRRSRIHLSLLLGSVALLKAWDYTLAAYKLLFSPRGIVYGASYADAVASLPGLRILTGISVFVALAIFVNLVRPAVRSILFGLGALAVSSFLIGGVYPNLVQEFVVRPNELEKELPYIQNHIAMTRRAYDLDKIERREFIPAEGALDPLIAQTHEATLKNIRLWDWRPLLATYNQLQTLRPYYSFVEVDIDRYRIGDELRQVMIAAREITSADLQNRSWVNLHLQYTHGYGFVMSPVNEVSAAGLPAFFVSNIPPTVTPQGAEALRIERPQIYYGEQQGEYVIVKTRRPEFDHPRGDENVTSFYEGTGGVPLGGYLRRALFAARFGTTRILLSTDITEESRVMFHREIGDRLRTLAPFLRFDSDPYLVLSEGRLYWIADAYTATDRFPYSAPVSGWGNYVRNSVKAVIDAYDGSVDFYIVEPEPIVEALSRLYPGVFKPIDQMPADLRSHIRYPEQLFALQAAVLTRYHMTNPQVFYNQEDVWELPAEVIGGRREAMQPYYVVMRLPDEEEEEFILMLPFTPVGRGNMIAWLAARNDGEHYGKLLVYEFSKQEITFGPMQFESRIDQDTEISSQLTLWSQQGSEVIRGNLLVFPLGDTVMYVEPLYLQAQQSPMPEFVRVIVGLGGRLVMRESFAEALEELLGVPPPAGPAGRAAQGAPGEPIRSEAPPREATGATPQTLISLAGEIFSEAQAAAGRGDWSRYGEALDRLAAVLDELAELFPAE